ncbi:hypothetical protein Desaci_0553 [Desulfosporosinus acidiphilus SJ4]|uniref:Uncharacterized protein n=1 Tax=Desulfosporosinus acidiphilus (strain DSM 22704 / JCM 16185 / SJ4) TaxID=646529 RepID=I4D1E4_DESAJ|nr:hypothetical protein [Desulfosporosinus acidiphilus]AFM39618.1 hypothetical protein Desaci_0553 [Desulfosporosinus acidiphilus SJ4]
MKKRIFVATLSMASIIGVAGIVNAATMGSPSSTSSHPSNASSYTNPNNVTGMGPMPRTNAQSDQTQQAQTTQTPSSQSYQAANQITMPHMNASVASSGQNIPINNQMQTMPMSTSMNGQTGNPQSMQGMGGTPRFNPMNSSSVVQPSSLNSRVNTMGAMGRMGR